MSVATTTSDLEFYLANKALLKQDPLRSSSIKRRGKFSGLRNQGATCYLNSLLQSLFFDAEFCRLILSCSDHKNSRIVHELQKLFAALACSNRGSIDTSPLLQAFGWSKSQMFEQHDIHEFFSVLLDALGKESHSLQADISRLFRGTTDDTLQCAACNFQSRTSSEFLNVSIDIPDQLETTVATDDSEQQLRATATATTAAAVVGFSSLQSLLKAQLAPEELDDDNKWTCSSCAKKTCAKKIMQYKKLPELLLVHLKRFRFDPISKRRRKLSTPVSFPAELDADAALKLSNAEMKTAAAAAVGHGSPSSVADTTTAATVDAGIDAAVSCFGKYRLAGIVLHTGTAMGGHYRCYLQPRAGGVWIDCNDDNVTELSAEETTALFATTAAEDNSNSSVSSKHSLVHENAYMLIYRAINDSSSADVTSAAAMGDPLAFSKSLIPSGVLQEIEEENKASEVVLRLQDIQQQLIVIDVKLVASSALDQSSSAAATVQLTVLKSATVEEITAQAYALLVQQLDAALFPIDQCRIRRFLRSGCSKLGETFGDGSSITVEDIGLQPMVTAALAFEVRRAEEPAFSEFHANDMYITVALWDPLQQCVAADSEQEVLVPGREHATVEALKLVLSAAFQLPTAATTAAAEMALLLLHDTTAEDKQQPVTALIEDAAELLPQYRVFPGARIVVEQLSGETAAAVAAITATATATTSTLSVAATAAMMQQLEQHSAALRALEHQRNSATIFFNDPSLDATFTATSDVVADATATPATAVYDLSIEVRLNQSLADVKAAIAQQLQLSDASAFHTKRSAAGPQLKDESKALSELAIVDQSILHLVLGTGCRSGEHLLRFELDTAAVTSTASLSALCTAPTEEATTTAAAASSGVAGIAATAAQNACVLIGEIAVCEKSTVLQMKQQLCDKWVELIAKLSDATTAATDSNSNSSVLHPSSFPPPLTPHHIRLRDGKGGKLSGPLRDDRLVGRCLLGLTDGRRVVVQLLESEEHIAADDIVVAVRVASYTHKLLSQPVDVPVSRTSTVKTLYEKLLALLPQLQQSVPEATAEDYKVEAQLAMTSGSSLEVEPVDFTATLPESAFLSLAKGYTSGPPLTLKSALKLKWDDPAVLQEAHVTPLDRPPLNLRDGSLVIVRGKADFALAQRTMRAKKAAAEALARENGLDPVATTGAAAGGGSAAVRAKSRARAARPRTQGGAAAAAAAAAAGARERGLKIDAGNTCSATSSAGVEKPLLNSASCGANGIIVAKPAGIQFDISATADSDLAAVEVVDSSKLSPPKPTIKRDALKHSMDGLPPPQQ